MIALHQLPANLHELREIKRPLFERETAKHRSREKASRYRSELVRNYATSFGFYALAIKQDDSLAAGYFDLAAECALSALGPKAGHAV